MQLANTCLKWSDEKDLWFQQYSSLADSVQEFLLNQVLVNKELASHVARRLWDVLHNCDEISYDEPGAAEAYTFLHFVDRYHRFQLISRRLIESGLLPIRERKIDILDIGTGPGPALYSLSDAYTMISRFGSEQGVSILQNLQWQTDYAERSASFRHWLHHFTEFLLSKGFKSAWGVPFHHGTFRDFGEIEFNITRETVECDDDGDDYVEQYTEKHRFDMVVLSNFLTTVDQVVGFAGQLQRCARYLRNRGVLLVVGARSDNRKYAGVYDKLTEVIDTGKYGNWKLVARCNPRWPPNFGHYSLIGLAFSVFRNDASWNSFGVR